MNSLTNLIKVYHRLMDLKDEGYEINIEEDVSKNYIAYHVEKRSGNAKYSDCILFYNGEKGEENECVCCSDVNSEELLKELNEIVEKINKIMPD